MAVTGGGTSVIADLFSVAGASNSVVEAAVPYHAAALQQYLASSRTMGCNTHTARAMAMVAYQRTLAVQSNKPVFGVGCTAAIATNRTRKGTDRCHVAVQSASRTTTFDLELDKNNTRAEQEAACNQLIVEAIASELDIIDPGQLASACTLTSFEANDIWQKLLAGDTGATSATSHAYLFPGAFNPFHAGHLGIIDYIRKALGASVTLEISIKNVDKPPLDFLSMSERLLSDQDMVFTNAPTFEEKSALFPGVTFVVGVDTIERIDDPKYYGSVPERNKALDALKARGNRFLVFGRIDGENFQTLSSCKLSPVLTDISSEIPEHLFRLDISSSELREKAL